MIKLEKITVNYRMVLEHELCVSVKTLAGSTKRINSKVAERIGNLLDEHWIQIDRAYNETTKLMDIFYLKKK